MLYRPALLTSLRAGYTAGDLLADVMAGLLVGVVALPLSLGLAIASGVKPEQGLFTAVVGGLLISLLGGSRVQIGGPAGAFVGFCLAGVHQFGYEGLALATLCSGALVLGMGLLRLGRAISYVPMPVVIGFTTAIALILASTQLGPALGIPKPPADFEKLHERLRYVWVELANGAWNGRSAAVCGATIAAIVVLRRLAPKAPGGLIAIVMVGTAAWLAGWCGGGEGRIATIASAYDGIPNHPPAPALPPLAHLRDLVMGAQSGEFIKLVVSLALLGSIESLLSAVVSDGMSGYRHDSNSELIGQGIANLVSPFFLGLPVTGVIARTSTNVRAGARTPVAGIVHALVVLAAMLVAAPLVSQVPLACLAGVLLVVCWYMAELRHWPHVLKAGRSDAVLLPLAFVLTAFVDLPTAILTCVALAMIFFVKRMSDAVAVERAPAGGPVAAPAGVEVYEVRGPFFFGAATLIRDLDADTGESPVLLLRLAQVPFIDATAAHALRELFEARRRKGRFLLLAEVHERARGDLVRHGLDRYLGEGRVFAELASALAVARELARSPG